MRDKTFDEWFSKIKKNNTGVSSRMLAFSEKEVDLVVRASCKVAWDYQQAVIDKQKEEIDILNKKLGSNVESIKHYQEQRNSERRPVEEQKEVIEKYRKYLELIFDQCNFQYGSPELTAKEALKIKE